MCISFLNTTLAALSDYDYDFQSSPLVCVIKDFIVQIDKRIAQFILKYAPDANISEQVNNVQDLIDCTVDIIDFPSINVLKPMLSFDLFCCMVYKKITQNILFKITKIENGKFSKPQKTLKLSLSEESSCCPHPL